MAENNYWEKRNKRITDIVNPDVKLKKLYRQSYRKQKGYIDSLYSYLEAGCELSRTELYQFSHFLKMKKAIKAECDTNLARLNKNVEKTLTQAYKETFKDTKYLLDSQPQWTTVNQKRLESCLKTKWSGKHFTTRNVKNYRLLAKSIEETVVDCIVNGKSKEECIKAVKYRNNVSYNQARALVQTETSYVINKASLDTYESEGVTEVEIMAENRERTCDLCRDKDGMIVKIKDAKQGKNIPPFHTNCHCDILPVVESMKKAKKEATKEPQKTEEQLTRTQKNDIIISGAVSGARNPEDDEAKAHAERYYGLIRSMKTDVKKISKNTGYSKKEIQSIKNFLFYDKHNLGREEPERFAPDYMIGESWRRLMEGNPEKHDLTLIKHEIMEKELMTKGYTQTEAHDITTKKYNYSREATEYYDKIKKHNNK